MTYGLVEDFTDWILRTELFLLPNDSQQSWQGRIQDSQKGGAQIQCSEYDNCMCAEHTIWHAKHDKSRGVWGHAPPENFEKLDPLRLNLTALLIVCYFFD